MELIPKVIVYSTKQIERKDHLRMIMKGLLNAKFTITEILEMYEEIELERKKPDLIEIGRV